MCVLHSEAVSTHPLPIAFYGRKRYREMHTKPVRPNEHQAQTATLEPSYGRCTSGIFFDHYCNVISAEHFVTRTQVCHHSQKALSFNHKHGSNVQCHNSQCDQCTVLLSKRVYFFITQCTHFIFTETYINTI